MVWFADEHVYPPLSQGHFIARSGEDLAYMVRCLQSSPDRAFDFETNGLRYADSSKHAIGYGVGFIASDGRPYAWYVPVRHQTIDEQANPIQARRAFRDALKGAESLIGHNLKFDLNMAACDGWEVPEDAQIHDTMQQAYLIYESRLFQLEKLVCEVPGATFWDPMQMKEIQAQFLRDRAKAHGMRYSKDDANNGIQSYLSMYGHAEVPVALEGEYCCRDIAHSLLLDRLQRDDAMGLNSEFSLQRGYLYQNEMLLVRAIADMQRQGQALDAAYFDAYAEELDKELDRRHSALAKLFSAPDIDFTNDNDIRDLLYYRMKLPVPKYTASGMPSVDQSALKQLRPRVAAIGELIDFALRYKIRTTYTKSMVFRQDDDGRIHPSFLLHGTKSGRLSSRDPNFQNIPNREPELAKRVRKGWVIDEGMARVYCDYSQIELRILAWVTGSKALTEAYRSPSYEALCRREIDYDTYLELRAKEPKVDVHAQQAINSFGADPADPDWKTSRNAAKIINFGVPYGMSAHGLMTNPSLMLPEDQAIDYFEKYHSGNPEIAATKNVLYTKMVQLKGVPYFANWAGRTVHAPQLRNPVWALSQAERRSVFASLIQGSAGELTRFSIVACWQAAREGRLPAFATSTVHDEIQFDCQQSDVPVVARTVRKIMEDTFRGRFGIIPIVADLEVSTTNWAEKEDYREAA